MHSLRFKGCYHC